MLVVAAAQTGPKLCCFHRIIPHQPWNTKSKDTGPRTTQSAGCIFTEMREVGARVEGPGLAQPSRWKSWEAEGIGRLVVDVGVRETEESRRPEIPSGNACESSYSPYPQKGGWVGVGQSPPWIIGEQPTAIQWSIFILCRFLVFY